MQNRVLENLFMEVIEDLSVDLDFYHAVPGILEKLREFFGFHCAFVYEVDHTGSLLRREFVTGTPELDFPLHIKWKELFEKENMDRLKKPSLFFCDGKDTALDPELEKVIRQIFDVKSFFLVPFLDQSGHLLGITGMGDGNRIPLSDEQIEWARSFFRIIANRVVMRSYHRQLANAMESLSHTLDNTGVDIYVNDFFTHEVLYVNKTMAAPYGGVENMIGKTCYSAIYNGRTEPCDYCPQNKLLDDDGQPTKVYSWDYQRPFDGAWFRVFSAAFRWVDGRLAHVVSSVDITDRKRYEEQQKRHERALREAVKTAEEATRMKSSFLANMSHEIRTPLNAIIGMAELIVRKEIPADVYDQAKSIKQAGAHLLAVINDVLDFSKIESGKIELVRASYSFASLVNDVISIIQVRAHEKELEFTTNIDANIPAVLIGDEFRIRQVLLNVLGNAVKYTDKGFVSFTVEGKVDEKKTAVELKIDVADSGPGISAEAMKTLFDPFVQVDMNTKRGTEGTGLGLTITRNLCHAMGGKIQVKSIVGEGSVFTVTIPQEIDQYEKLVAVEDPEGKRVLIYESRKIYVDSITRSCQNMGVLCKAVTNQTEFMESILEETYDFAFVAGYMLESAQVAFNRIGAKTKIVVLTEYGETPKDPSVQHLSMAAYCINIGNILNEKEPIRTIGSIDLAAPAFSAPTAKILITDDNLTNLKVAQGLMSPYMMQIDVCTSGVKALEMVRKCKYDIVFMDHMMPEMDGLETTAMIRALGKYDDFFRTLPIIALTANAAFDAREMFLNNGIDDFLAKPIEVSRLNAILDKWIPQTKKKDPKPVKQVETTNEIVIEGIDVNTGIYQTGGSLNGYLQVLRKFHSESNMIMQEIRKSLSENNIDLFTRYVHSIKSSAGSIGAMDIFEMAKSLEAAGNIKNTDFIQLNAKPFLGELKAILDRIEPVLQKAFPSATQKNKNSTDTSDDQVPAQVKEKLPRLRDALDQLELQQAESILQELTDLCQNEQLREIFDQIGDDLLTSSFDEAVQKIDELLGNVGSD